MSAPLVRIEGLRKEFRAVVAVEDVTLEVSPGEIVALVGDNGAGKSTVVKCIAGVHAPTAGRILLEGRAVEFSSPLDARSQGIEVVFQDLALASAQPVYMNMFLGRELVKGPLRRLDREAMAAETKALLDRGRRSSSSATRSIRSSGSPTASACCGAGGRSASAAPRRPPATRSSR